jgi:trimethylamine--corrinoid protein Co-methyltransferase
MKRKYELKILSDSDVERIHQESLKILKELGIKFPHKELLNSFKKMGALVDFDTEIVKFPPEVIENALAIQRKNTDEYFEKYEPVDENDYTQKFFMSGGNNSYHIDPDDFKRKAPTLEDMLKAIVVGNALDNVIRISGYYIPAAYDELLADIIQFYLLSLYSKKRYFFTYIYSLESAKCLIEMTREIAENEHQFMNGSLIEYEIEPCGHLEFAREHLEIAAEFAKNKMKIATTHWAWMGRHTPLTYASLLSLTNAHILAGTAALIALNPDNMYYRYIFPTHNINPRYTSLPLMAQPNMIIYAWAARQLADFYGFKYCITNSGFSNEIQDNFQCGFEVGVTAALSIAAGITCLGVKGLHGCDEGVSMERLVTDNELIDYLNFVFSRSINIDDSTLEYENIKSKARGEWFLEDLKDERKMKEMYWNSDIFYFGNYEDWHENIGRENIKKKIEKILEENFPPSLLLPLEKVENIEGIMKTHVKDKGFVDRLKNDLERIFEN